MQLHTGLIFRKHVLRNPTPIIKKNFVKCNEECTIEQNFGHEMSSCLTV